MSEPERPIVFSICGQEFRLRATGEDGERVKKVAAAVEGMIRERKGRAMQSDLRAAIMTAYELAFELQELREELASTRPGEAAEVMDRLLQSIDSAMHGATEGDASPSRATGKEKQNKRR